MEVISFKVERHEIMFFKFLVQCIFVSKRNDELMCAKLVLSLNPKQCRQIMQEIKGKNEAENHKKEQTCHFLPY